MCGFAGAAWNSDARPLSFAELRRMTHVLTHRGPDDHGFWTSGLDATFSDDDSDDDVPGDLAFRSGPAAALGHRRLSIIDLAGGRQPLANEDGSIQVAFNGEIYNYRELQSRLQAAGHRFSTDTDTETIVHLYEDYGADCVHHLRGMFAFALWDEQNKRLLLARDRTGQKPLFYRRHGSHRNARVDFASELKALLQVDDAPRELNARAMGWFLTYQYVPHPHSILDGYSKLPPAHRAVFENGRLTVQRYWSPPFADAADNETTVPVDAADWSPERWRTELRERLTEAVRLRMRSDVPLGAFLSGGVDSTIVAGLMQGLSDRPVHTFSIGFPVEQFDERAYAREAAAHLGTEHHEWVVEPSALATLPRLIWQYDEPFSDSSAIPTMYLSEKTREQVTVSLSGDGGDELFAGYDRYKAVALGSRIDRLPSALRKFAAWDVWQHMPASTEQMSFRRRLKRFLAGLGQSPERRYLKWIGIFDDDRLRYLLTDEFKERLGEFDSAEFLLDAYAACPSRDFVTRTTCTDVLTYLPCDILTKVDVASMTYGLECRSPLLDHHVVELAARMPIELKLRGATGKRILTETFSDLLPESIQRRRKMGFGVPIDHWFRNELKPLLTDALLDSRSLDRGYFNPDAVRTLIDEHVNNEWDHSYRLWALLCLEMWHRVYLDPAAAPMECPA